MYTMRTSRANVNVMDSKAVSVLRGVEMRFCFVRELSGYTTTHLLVL